MAASGGTWTHHEGEVNGVRLHWVEQGRGPLVVLLHGFPELWYEWRHLIPALAAAGFRAVAPDMRGYNLSEKPKGVEPYALRHLTADVAALVRHLGETRAHVVGHDWGGVVAWRLAMDHAEVVDRLVIVNAPHPRVFARELRKPKQALKSAYAAFFQLPAVPEAVFRANGYAMVERVFRDEPRPGAYTGEDIALYKEAIARPGALKAMINYYRAAVRHPAGESLPVTAPTLVVWGEDDAHLNVENTIGLEEHVPGVRVERLPGVSHWVPADAPEELAALVTRFLHAAG